MRTKPYTAEGIKRVPCFRCGEPASQQWNICSLPGYYAICTSCDVALNKTVLKFMKVPNVGKQIGKYKKSLET